MNTPQQEDMESSLREAKTDAACVRAINAQMKVFARQDYEASGRFVQRNLEQVPKADRPKLMEAMRAALDAALNPAQRTSNPQQENER